MISKNLHISKIELAIHAVVLLFYFTSINVEWTANWFDRSIRLRIPAPLSVLIFPIYFYVNAFLLIPRYLSTRKWKWYAFFAFLLFVLPELIRCSWTTLTFGKLPFADELFSRDSFLFGAPSPFFFALNASFLYRFARDWFINKSKIAELESQTQQQTSKPPTPYENTTLLEKEEANQLHTALLLQLEEKQVFLNPELTLRELAETIQTSEKKLSYLLNQNLDTNFYELLNKYRVEKFKTTATDPKNQNLSIVGIALNCGFPSKSSFYRAFKTNVGTSPSAYLKKLKKTK